MAGPLAGVRVIEFTQVIAGPVAGMLLSDLGADVIKVEPPQGESWRLMTPLTLTESRGYIAVNRGKRDIAIDLAQPQGREVAHRLIRGADVMLVNYRADVPARLEIDYEAVSKMNPRLIYCELTAFGRKGPSAGRPGYDRIVQAETGMMASEGVSEAGLPRPVLSTPPADLAAGHSMATAVCAALYHRERTGRGQRIETTLFANALMLQVLAITNIESRPSPAQKFLKDELAGRRESGQSFEEIAREYHRRRVSSIYRVYYQPYRTRDWLIMPAALSESLQKKMMGTLGLHDPRFDPGQDPTVPAPFEQDSRLIEQIEAVFESKTTAEWLAIFEKAGVPAGTVNFAEEMVNSGHARESRLIVDQEHPVFGRISTVGPILNMSETPAEAARSAPALGQHTDEILKELGYSQTEVAALRAMGIFGRQ
ncbi:MAG: CoA transferase [Chloroflexi bacterium]|nr:CoA transferase [Chloroflexota bacterium]